MYFGKSITTSVTASCGAGGTLSRDTVGIYGVTHMSLVSRGLSEIITCKCCLQHSQSFNSLPVVLLGTPNHAKMMMPMQGVTTIGIHVSVCTRCGLD